MKFLNLCTTISLFCLSTTAIAAQHLKYPADCKNKVLEAAAKKNGCYITEGKGHKLVYNSSKVKVTEIPNSVKDIVD